MELWAWHHFFSRTTLTTRLWPKCSGWHVFGCHSMFVCHWPCNDGSISLFYKEEQKQILVKPAETCLRWGQRELDRSFVKNVAVYVPSVALPVWVTLFSFLQVMLYFSVQLRFQNILSHDDGWQDFLVCFGAADYSCVERTVCLFLLCPLFEP